MNNIVDIRELLPIVLARDSSGFLGIYAICSTFSSASLVSFGQMIVKTRNKVKSSHL